MAAFPTELPADLASALARDFAADFLTVDPAERAEYGRDWTRIDTPAPSAVAFPRTTDEVSRLLALCNARGNVMALMPHPERATSLGQVSRTIGGDWGARRERALATADGSAFDDGPGMVFFHGLARHLEVSA